jgi:CHAT domain-containing protein
MSCQQSAAQTGDKLKDSLEAELVSIQEKYYYSNMDSALLLFQRVADAAAKHEYLDTELSAILNMAWCTLDFNELDRFQEYLNSGYSLIGHREKQLDIVDQDREIRSQFIYTSAMFYYTLGQFEQARNEFNTILYNKENVLLPLDSILVFNTYTSIGKCYYNLGNYEKAIETYGLAFQMIPRQNDSYFGLIDDDYYFALNRSQVGEAHFKRGQVEENSRQYFEAKPYYMAALKKLEAKPLDNSIKNLLLTNYNRMAALYQASKVYDSALMYLNKSIATAPKNDLEVSKTYLALGDLYLELNDHDKAISNYRKRLTKLNETIKGKHFAKGIAIYHVGKAHASQGKVKEALTSYQVSLGHFVTSFKFEDPYQNPRAEVIGLSSTNEVMQILSLKAAALRAEYQLQHKTKSLEAAIRTYELVDSLIDKMRREFPTREFKEFLSSKSFAVYEGVITALYEMYQRSHNAAFLNKAFKFAEKSKSILLLESFRNTNAKHVAGISQSIIQNEEQMISSIIYLEGILLKEEDAQERMRLTKKISALKRDHAALVKSLETEHPAYFRLKYNLDGIPVNEVHNRLLSKNDAAMIEYVVGTDYIYMFVITHDDIDFLRESITHDLAQHVVDLREGLMNNNFNQYASNATSLYLTLFKNVGEILQRHHIRNLTIVPDGCLHYLPFEILLKRQPEVNGTFTNLSYLIRDYLVHYQFSATIAAEQLLSVKPNPPHDLLAYAPDFSAVHSASNTGRDITRNELQPLPGALDELKNISRHFNGEYFTERAATEHSFKEYCGQYKILHLATHAIVDDRYPALSRLMFSDATDTLEDGSLFIYELYNLKLNAELVTLSACNTGIGKLHRGEGLMSLGRGFMYAGCPNVVMSLWPVSDQSTAKLMDLFYNGLKKGENKDEALRNAKLSLLNSADPQASNPYFWAAFTLVGQPDAIRANESLYFWKIAVGVILLIGIVTIVILRRRKLSAHK